MVASHNTNQEDSRTHRRQELASIRHRFCRYGLKHVTTASPRCTLCCIRFFFLQSLFFIYEYQSNPIYYILPCLVSSMNDSFHSLLYFFILFHRTKKIILIYSQSINNEYTTTIICVIDVLKRELAIL